MNDGDTWVKLKMHKVKGKKRKKVKTNKKIIPSSPAMQCVWVQASFFPLANSDYDCTMIVTEARLPGEVQ